MIPKIWQVLLVLVGAACAGVTTNRAKVESTMPTLTAPEASPTQTLPLTSSENPTPTLTPVPSFTPTETPTPVPTNTPFPTSSVELGVPMVLIPAGFFKMGSDYGESDERPMHEVFLGDFYMDQYEVTNEQYASCVDAGICAEQIKSELRDPEFAQYPVRFVNWFDAQTFCVWRRARLPTEAEWEKAARGGLEGMTYPWGDEEPTCELGAENGAQFWDCEGKTVPIGSFAPNGYGLYDMAGNVWEWVADWYSLSYYSTLQDGVMDPKGPESGGFRVLRGGGWSIIEISLRSAYRLRVDPDRRDVIFGFRCARSP